MSGAQSYQSLNAVPALSWQRGIALKVTIHVPVVRVRWPPLFTPPYREVSNSWPRVRRSARRRGGGL